MTEPEVEGLPGPRWIALSFVVYVVLGYLYKSIFLNWIIGPTWLLLTLHVIPRGVRSLLGRVGSR
ncbi:MAG TPA: hypothetical protein P5254_16595 [Aquihabitans sp.]|nr:hypothetical protein [Aquihabitans sp.]